MDEKILEIFRTRKDEYISGEDLSQSLNVSRTAIWKHIETLREEGYDIAAYPHLGYKLIATPDKLLAQEILWHLGNKIIGKKIYSYNEVNSTNDIAYKLGEAGFEEGAAVFSEGQTQGRGRLSRKWISPYGSGIYMSVLLRPNIVPNEAPKITTLAAVSVANAIRKLTNLDAMIKWPNDILVNNKKVAGLLTEMSAELDLTKFIVLGIGINVNTAPSLLPATATSLKKELKNNVSRIELARRILKELESNYILFKENKFNKILSIYKSLSMLLLKRVRILCHNRKIEGQALDIDSTGALVIRLDNGFVQNITTGDVIMAR